MARRATGASASDRFDVIKVSAGLEHTADEIEFSMSQHTVVLWRSKWPRYVARRPLQWEECRLARSEGKAIPDVEGVYMLLVRPGLANHPADSFLMYVGMASSLRKRFGNYLNEERCRTGRPMIFDSLNRYSDFLWFVFAKVPGASKAELKDIEDDLMEAYIPAWNDKFPAWVGRIVKAWRRR